MIRPECCFPCMSEARPADPINVVVAGALGRMGAEVVKAVHGAADCQLVGAIDTTPGKEGVDVGEALGLGPQTQGFTHIHPLFARRGVNGTHKLAISSAMHSFHHLGTHPSKCTGNNDVDRIGGASLRHTRETAFGSNHDRCPTNRSNPTSRGPLLPSLFPLAALVVIRSEQGQPFCVTP